MGQISIIRCLMNEYSDKLVNQMVALYTPQTTDDELTIRNNINRFSQLLDSTAKKLADQNPLVMRVVPPELQQNNKFRDITLYKNYETVVNIVKAVETKKQKFDPYKQAIETYKAKDKYKDPALIGRYVASFKLNLPRLVQAFEDKDENIIHLIPQPLLKDERYKNILNYSFTDLEHLIDGAFADTNDEKSEINSAEVDADLVYQNKQTGIEVYKGDQEHLCIKYSHNRYYAWCIGNTMYSNYRFMQSDPEQNRMFYFVFDRTKSDKKEGSNSFEDPYHAVVIHAHQNGLYRRSLASNNGDRPERACKWEDLGNVFEGKSGKDLWNKIKDLKAYFPFIPPSADERRQLGFRGQRLTLDNFIALPFDDKQAWLRVNANDNNLVTSEIVKSLPSNGEISKNDLINHSRIFNYDELKNDPRLAKRYAIYRWTRFREEAIPYPLIRFLDESAQEEYYKKYEETYLCYEIIEEYFSENVLKKYIAQQLSLLSYLPEASKKYMTPAQIKVYDSYNMFLKNISITTSKFDPEKIPSAIEQKAMIIKFDYQSYKQLDNKEREQFLHILKSVPSEEKYSIFIYGCPISFVVNNRLYMILPENNKEDSYYVLINENGDVIKRDIEQGEIYFWKNGEESRRLEGRIPIGKSTIYLKENEFDSIELGYKQGKTEKLDLKNLEQFNESTIYQNNILKHRAGIIK